MTYEAVHPVFGWLKSLAFTVGAFAIVNLVLVGGQKLWHHADQEKLNALKSKLHSEHQEIKSAEARLEDLRSQLQQANTLNARLKTTITAVDTQYPSGIPSELYGSYTQWVARYNERVSEHNSALHAYNALYARYSKMIVTYNVTVKKVNTLAKNIGGTWYVIPVPIPRLGAHNRRQRL